MGVCHPLAQHDGGSALYIASQEGYLPIVQALLAHSKDSIVNHVHEVS
jgi:hypothetical protein